MEDGGREVRDSQQGKGNAEARVLDDSREDFEESVGVGQNTVPSNSGGKLRVTWNRAGARTVMYNLGDA